MAKVPMEPKRGKVESYADMRRSEMGAAETRRKFT